MMPNYLFILGVSAILLAATKVNSLEHQRLVPHHSDLDSKRSNSNDLRLENHISRSRNHRTKSKLRRLGSKHSKFDPMEKIRESSESFENFLEHLFSPEARDGFEEIVLNTVVRLDLKQEDKELIQNLISSVQSMLNRFPPEVLIKIINNIVGQLLLLNKRLLNDGKPLLNFKDSEMPSLDDFAIELNNFLIRNEFSVPNSLNSLIRVFMPQLYSLQQRNQTVSSEYPNSSDTVSSEYPNSSDTVLSEYPNLSVTVLSEYPNSSDDSIFVTTESNYSATTGSID